MLADIHTHTLKMKDKAQRSYGTQSLMIMKPQLRGIAEECHGLLLIYHHNGDYITRQADHPNQIHRNTPSTTVLETLGAQVCVCVFGDIYSL